MEGPEDAEINRLRARGRREAVIRSRPQETREHDGADHENAAHRRHALFGAVQFSQPMHFVRRPDRLAGLERNQFPDDEIAEGQRKNERRDRRCDRAKRHITKDVEAFDLLTQEMEVIHHGVTSAVDWRFANASSTRSIRAERLPLTRIKSPGEAVSPRSSAASSAAATEVFLKQAFCAVAPSPRRLTHRDRLIDA